MEKQAREMRGLFTRLKTKVLQFFSKVEMVFIIFGCVLLQLKTQELALVKKEETLVETETNNARLKAMVAILNICYLTMS